MVDTKQILKEIPVMLEKGDAKGVKEQTQKAIDQGVLAVTILNDGLVSGMNVVGTKFKNNEIFIPEVLIAARAMKAGMEVIKPLLIEAKVEPRGKVIIGTVKGDLHGADEGWRVRCSGYVRPSDHYDGIHEGGHRRFERGRAT